MRSLSTKLTLAFLVVGVLGVGLVALLLNWRTSREFDRFVQDLYQDDLMQLEAQLAQHYSAYGSWDGIGAVLIRDQSQQPFMRREQRWLRVTLVDASRVVVYGGGARAAGARLSAGDVRDGTAIEVDGQVVGWLLLNNVDAPGERLPGAPEASFLANVNQATLLSALGAAAAALLLGAFLARTISNPVAELTAATRQVADGQLGVQVPVRTGDELGALAASFNHMSADLALADRQRQQMTADIAHDLRTPMSVILGYAESLTDGKLPGTPEIYAVLYQEARHLNRLIEDLRTLSLADAGELALQPRLQDPEALLRQAALAHAGQAEAQSIKLQVVVAPDLPALWLDPERMAQVLGNLVSNALRYTPPGGSLTLAAARSGSKGRLAITVTDTGSGISAEDLPHVFDRFYRGDRARHQPGESGLGLAIARSIVHAHGGEIRVDSTPGEGTRFTIMLPLDQPTASGSSGDRRTAA